jgi:hypothetical protein
VKLEWSDLRDLPDLPGLPDRLEKWEWQDRLGRKGLRARLELARHKAHKDRPDRKDRKESPDCKASVDYRVNLDHKDRKESLDRLDRQVSRASPVSLESNNIIIVIIEVGNMVEETGGSKESPLEAKKPNGAFEPVVVKLRKSIMVGDEEISELTFREPTAADIERCGNPVNIDFISGDTPKMTFDVVAMSKMMSTLSGVAPPIIKRLNTRDWNTAAWNLASFFLPEM